MKQEKLELIIPRNSAGKRIDIENLNYWNVELQEPYFSYKEAFQKKEQLNKK